MTRIIHLTNQQARRLLLAKHGLWPPQALDGKVACTDGIHTVYYWTVKPKQASFEHTVYTEPRAR